ncbi:hypothetical protein STCU_00637 [Strigomonas culicis]|nr:hypothetical protein STCU_03747 [Strigomonas culicis]EPY36335.1 hypothetical protein STCU_00637 [Strigomonas culicis]|eukprot:EPY30956.1 hypothetical protein STCU_03747 [Strigomonas culicis]
MADAALDALVAFIALPEKSRTVNIPKPLRDPLKNIVADDVYKWLTGSETKKVHVDVLNLAVYLKYDEMSCAAAAYVAERLDEVAKQAPDIMTGAEHIRNYLNLKNEWSEEEMKHLAKEMAYAKEVNSSAY